MVWMSIRPKGCNRWRRRLTKRVLAELVVAAEAAAVHLVHGDQLAQRVQGAEPGQDHGDRAAGPRQILRAQR